MKTYNEMIVIASWLGNQSLYGGSRNIMSSAYDMAYTMSIVYGVTEKQWMKDVEDYITEHKAEISTMKKPWA